MMEVLAIISIFFFNYLLYRGWAELFKTDDERRKEFTDIEKDELEEWEDSH